MSQELIQNLIIAANQELQQRHGVADDVQFPTVTVERARNKEHGDFSTNFALASAKLYQKPPRVIAEELCELLGEHAVVEKVEIAGPGFINFFLAKSARLQIINDLLLHGAEHQIPNVGNGEKVLLEFLSTNPTGPLHVGHGRHAAVGASVANILKTLGYDVHSEYYVNDGGRQIDILALSVCLRYIELFRPLVFEFPASCYQGDYITQIAQDLYEHKQDTYLFDIQVEQFAADLEGDKVVDLLVNACNSVAAEKFAAVKAWALQATLADIKDDLQEFGVTFDRWFSEESLHQDGSVAKVVELLKAQDLMYQQDGAWWFKASQFGDEKDRVIVRSNGQYTYITPDIAYHLNKFTRGFKSMVDIIGADHHGYVTRLRAALDALLNEDYQLAVRLVQFVLLYRNQERVQMSTRSGSFVTLRELRQEVGNDATRFFYVMRKVDQPMDFDIELAKSKTAENPVYYVQYAHARICSIFAKAEEQGISWQPQDALQHLELLATPHEFDLAAMLNKYQEIVVLAGKYYEPHRLAQYLIELATLFHSYYNNCNFLNNEQQLRDARLALCCAVQKVLHSGLGYLGVSAPNKM